MHTVDGLTQPVYDDYRLAHGELPRPIGAIEPAEVGAVYFWLWRRAWLDQVAPLPAERLALAIFDGVVNQGLGEAVMVWQRVVRTPADEIPGPHTIAQTEKRVALLGELAVVEAYLELRYGAYQRILIEHPEDGRFAHGWRNRLNALCAQLGIPPVWPGLH